MLDPHGFVASCNSTNFFIVRGDELWTSTGRYNFKGITRRKITELYRAHGGVDAKSTSRSRRSTALTKRSSPERSAASRQ